MGNKINVAVLGSSGYVGMEIVRILSNHENVNIVFLGSESNNNKHLVNIENTKTYLDLPVMKHNKSFDPSNADYVFLSLPHSVSNKYVNSFYNKIKIIDLSADFRLDNHQTYIENYGDNHDCAHLLNEFVYGLVEVNKKNIYKTNNIAVPGCYPTSVLLPLIPMLDNNLIKPENIIIDSKSGYSGAGKKFDIKLIKSDDDFNLYNYNTNSHRHIAEIKQELIKHSLNKKVSFSFNPHIVPSFRGMMSTIYCDLNDNITKGDITNFLTDFDKNNYFIKFIKDNERLDFFSIQNTNYCKIKIFDHYCDNKIIIVSNIDNLIKGAAGQAIQCFNLMENFEETKALV